MKIFFSSIGVCSEKGPVRRRNEDAYLIARERGLYAVADGLGGLPGGQFASRFSLETLLTEARNRVHFNEQELASLVQIVHEKLQSRGLEEFLGGCGTTLTLAFHENRTIRIAHVGDSSAHLYRRNSWINLTREDTIAGRLRAENREIEVCPQDEHMLTQCIGQDAPIDPELITVAIEEGDVLLLASDGVTGSGDLPALDEHSGDAFQEDIWARALCDSAYRRSATDNATALILRFTTTKPEDKPHSRETGSIGP